MKRQRSYGLRSRAWWIIRKNKTVTLADLLMVLNDGSHKNSDRNLGQYLTLLTRVGVLSRERMDDGKSTSNGVYQYRLVNDLGVKNPIIRQDGVFDANSKTLLRWSGVQTPGLNESQTRGLDSSVESNVSSNPQTRGLDSCDRSSSPRLDTDAGDELLASVGMGVCDESA